MGGKYKISTIPVRCDDVEQTVDLEKALSTTGYGTFNVLLLAAALPIAWTGIFDTTTTVFILAAAECDLRLTFIRNGVLLAFPFIGMTTTSFLWDYITPYIGLRNLFVLSLFFDTVLNVLSSAVESYTTLLIIKFFSGILVGGPLSMATIYLSDFHSTKYKASFTRWSTLAVNVGFIVPAILAFSILPQSWVMNVLNRRYTSWRIYLLVCSIIPLLGLLTASSLPQSPKYFLEIGRPDHALKLLRIMYSVNKRKSADTFPIKALLTQQTAYQLSLRSFFRQSSERLRLSCYNAKLLFSEPYLLVVSHLGFLQFSSMLAFNTMRLWVPHLFIILNNFDKERWIEDRRPTMHEMLDPRWSLPAREHFNCSNFDELCLTWTIFSAVFQKSTIIALSTVTFSFLAGILATSKLKKKTILLTTFLLSLISSFGVNWAYNVTYMLILSSMIIVTMRIAGNIITAMNAEVIPLPLRSSSLSVLTTIGNVGAILGNLILSAFLNMTCIGPFLGLGCLLLACFCVSFCYPEPIRASPRSLTQSNA
ncbi:synaptic vesicle glycoprotein 2C isoform X2 [Calliopsis andreniformis]|uniref:synaptic vesicle glycoprotein 2C isoform X2 n=1 Tax=Calliopsis andreniformis TaxID=337506 RepID=UPI003FCCCE76